MRVGDELRIYPRREREIARATRDFSAELNPEQLAAAAHDDGPLLAQLREGDYFAIQAFIEMNEDHVHALDAMRVLVRDHRKVATTVGFGPRFLHSTGQAHKGGPNSGVFLQITCDDENDLPVPGQKYTFGIVKAAQARGDFEVLSERGRRALRVHLAADVDDGLRRLGAAIKAAVI